MKIFVGCSSSDKIDKSYFKGCEDYLKVVMKDHDLVFGGCYSGLMATTFDVVRSNHHEITGISPNIFKDEIDKSDCDIKIMTESISTRTQAVIDKSDAIIYLPGGIGTLYEFFQALESKRSHEMDKPIILFNYNHYFDKLLALLEQVYEQKFGKDSIRDCYYVTTDPIDTLNYLNNYNKKTN